MKELSIEQKAKAYDEALNWMRDLYPNLGIAAKEKAESIFKELRESEDEKIRKELIDIVKKSPITFAFEDKGKVLAWLEKQGRIESDPRYENIEELLAADDIYQMSMNDEMVREAKEKAVNALSGMCIGRLLGLEKQGKQKPSLRERYDKIKDSEWFKKTHEGMSISDDENADGDMKETEHTIKPKFHEGEWIVDNQGLTHQIERVVENVTTHTFGYDIVGGGYFNDNTEGVHLWTIQDAKDGDILVEIERDIILMFRGIGNTEWDDVIDYHCYYDCYRKDFIVQEDVNYWGNTENNQLKPATKEQRDLLFSKMKESGYEWDTEKKGLKLLITNGGDFSETENCGQKPVEWKQENREELTEFENAMMHIGGSFFGENAGLDPNDTATIKEQAKLLLELAPKTEWSEEDEKEYKYVLKFIDNILNNCDNDKDYEHCKRCYDFLESLKERYTWKPSDEQMDALYTYIYNPQYFNSPDSRMELVESVYKDLKKLRKE